MSYPFLPAPFETQDFKDDDAEVIDDLVKTTSAPADPVGAVIPVVPETQYQAKGVTRVYSDTRILGGGTPAQRIFTEDVNRGTCKVKAYSTNGTPANITYNDFCIIADDLGKVSAGAQGICITLHHAQTADLDGHTGQIWVIPGPGMTAAIEVTAWAVTTMDGSQMNNV